MTAECSSYRNLIPRAMMGDLSAEEQHSLNLHLAECAPCHHEHVQYAETLRQMRSVSDVPVPRHFFVYREYRAENPWQLFRRMSLAWQGAIATVILLFGVLTASAALRLNIRSENGAWILSLGKPITRNITPAQTPPVDIADIEAKILKVVEEKNRMEKIEWVRTLRIEIEKSSRSMTERQHKILQVALSDLEMRLGGQVAVTARSLEERSDKGLSSLYQAVSAERERDMATLYNRLDRLAVNGEMRSSQTDAILETLLQVAELKLK
jgi:hypothetical protein